MAWPQLAARLRRRWRLAAGLGALCCAGGLAVALQSDRPYTATAFLAVARPDPAVRVRPPAASETNVSTAGDDGLTRLAQSRAYAELVGTPGIAGLVRQALEGRVPTSWGADALLRRVRTRALAEGALIRIEAHGASPAQAADIANTWATTFSRQVESLFGNEGDLSAVLRLRDEARAELAVAEAGAENAVAASGGSAAPAASAVVTTTVAGAEREKDLAAERYVALARRAAELTTSAVVSRPELRVASPAVPPEGRDWARLAAWPLAGLILGLILGLAGALAPSRTWAVEPPSTSGSVSASLDNRR